MKLTERVARFDSKCKKCKQIIYEGERILWEPGYAEHLECPPAGNVSSRRAITTRDLPVKGFTIIPDEPLFLVRDNARDEAIYAQSLDEAFAFIRRQLEPVPEPEIENVGGLPVMFASEDEDEFVEHEILRGETVLTNLGQITSEPPDDYFGPVIEDEETPSNVPQLSTIPDGTYTVVFNDDENDYVTFRLKTKGPNSNYEGKQIASYLAGPDNSRDFVGFAFVDTEVHLWRRFQGSGMERYVTAIKILFAGKDAQRESGEAYALRSNNCFRCGRQLTVPTSVHRGLGPECAEKF